MKYSAVIFDFNGTMFFDTDFHMIAWNKIFQELCGKPVTLAEIETKYSGMPNHKILELLSPGKTPAFYHNLSLRKEALYREEVKKQNPTLAPGIIELLNELKKRNIPMTIASASIKENIDFFIEIFHLERWFHPNQIIYDNGSYENKINMFEDARKVLNCTEKAIIFEDSLSGIQSASYQPKNDLIVIDNPTLKKHYESYPSIIKTIHSYNEIIPLLDEWF